MTRDRAGLHGSATGGERKARAEPTTGLILLTSCATGQFERRSKCARSELHVKLPVFDARQWNPPRTANVNE